MKMPRKGIVALIAIAIVLSCAYAGRGVSSQSVKPAGAYSPEVVGTISEINPSNHTLVIIADRPCLSYNIGDRLKISLRQTLWDSSFSGESTPTIGSRVSIWLFPVGSDEADLEGMSIEVVNESKSSEVTWE